MGDVGSGTDRWSSLDGVRALAVALVVATHFHLDTPDGQIGVDVFFVLSGFLITSLLLRERTQTNTVSLSNFWKRRASRLFPALGCAISLALLLSLIATPPMRHATLAGLPYVFLYVGNLDKAFGGPQTLGLLVHTWSLAVEEQFYVLWPLLGVAWWCRSSHRSRTALVVAALAMADGAYFVVALNRWGAPRAIFASDTHSMGLLAGSALAIWLFRHGTLATLEGPKAHRLEGFGSLATLAIIVLAITQPIALSILLATAAAVILVATLVRVPQGILSRLFASTPLRWIGKRSYGIYLYHFPIAVVFIQEGDPHGALRALSILACIATSVCIAAASYRWVESPFLRRKESLQFQPPSPVKAESAIA